jgi:zinc D-Ala-D-Ala carboxypeptidase
MARLTHSQIIPRAGAVFALAVAFACLAGGSRAAPASGGLTSSEAGASVAAVASAEESPASATSPSRAASPAASSSEPAAAGASASPSATAVPLASGDWPGTNLEPLPACTFGETITPMPKPSQWALTLVDTNFAVPSTYAPDDLVPASRAGLSSYQTVRAVVIGALGEMAKAARAAGAPLGIASSYRDYRTQVWTFWHWVNELGLEKALDTSARAGHSEHQLGVAIDFKEPNGAEPWRYRDFAGETKAGAWLVANAWRYGFVMSYPRGKTAQTCYAYEPWHYRFFGVSEALAMHASGLTPREWLWRHQPNPEGPSPMSTPSASSVAPSVP